MDFCDDDDDDDDEKKAGKARKSQKTEKQLLVTSDTVALTVKRLSKKMDSARSSHKDDASKLKDVTGPCVLARA